MWGRGGGVLILGLQQKKRLMLMWASPGSWSACLASWKEAAPDTETELGVAAGKEQQSWAIGRGCRRSPFTQRTLMSHCLLPRPDYFIGSNLIRESLSINSGQEGRAVPGAFVSPEAKRQSWAPDLRASPKSLVGSLQNHVPGLAKAASLRHLVLTENRQKRHKHLGPSQGPPVTPWHWSKSHDLALLASWPEL
uniref:Uncharacterized protein n=1 Tax=Micrurus lemniscatus lemniscatus TaxID=129467 RepID=A0A2D4IIQ5_MICLE